MARSYHTAGRMVAGQGKQVVERTCSGVAGVAAGHRGKGKGTRKGGEGGDKGIDSTPAAA